MELSYIILGITILFLLIMFGVGYSAGLMKILLTFAATVVALVLSLVLLTPTENLLKKTSVYNTVNKQTTKYVEKHIDDGVDASTEEMQKNAIKDLKLPSGIKNKMAKEYTPDKRLQMNVDTVSEYVAKSLTDILVRAAAILLLYLSINIVLGVLVVVLNVISKLPVINGINKLLGGAAGLVEAVVIIWILCCVVTAFAGTAAGSKVLSAIASNEMLNYIYCNNPIMKLILK